MDAKLRKQPALRSAKVLDYLKVKGRISSYTFLDHVGNIPHDGQRTLIDAYMEKMEPSEETRSLGLSFDYRYKTFVAACGRRWGKSFIVSNLAAEEMMYPNSQVLICSYRLENCKVIFRQVREIIKALGIEIVADRQKELELELANGAKLCVASNDNVESRLGNSISLLIVDEAKLFQRDLYETFLEPQLLDFAPYSRSILISSPKEGWLQDYYDRGQSTLPEFDDFWSTSFPTSSNPTISKAYLEKLRLRVPPDVWEQEYEGKFVSTAGKVFKEFDRIGNVFGDVDFPRFWDWVYSKAHPVVHSIDSGYVHYFAGIYILHMEELDTYFLFGEYQLNKKVTPIHAENIQKYERTHGIDPYMRFADPAAAQQIADLTEYDLYYNLSTKSTRESINAVNTLFFQVSKVTNRKRLLVHDSCGELIRQINQVGCKEDSTNLARESNGGSVKPFMPDDNKTDWDLIDALRYGIFSYLKLGNIDLSVIDHTLILEGEDDDYFEEDHGFYAELAKQGMFRVSSNIDDDD
jgi:hypothetical protein